MATMICGNCGRTGIYWRDLWGLSPYTYCPNCMDCYRPRPFWMPSERAGLKAMGEEIKSCQKWQGPGCFEAAIATTRAYVRAAIEVKKERTSLMRNKS